MTSPTPTASDDLSSFVRPVPDYPVPGVVFQDITPLLADGAAFGAAIAAMARQATHTHGAFDVVTGMEARGFVIGAALAVQLGIGFVPLRKAGKLPPPVESVTYDLEYGQACLELRSGTLTAGARVLVVDDVLATGGTASAAVQLVERSGGEVVGTAFLLEIAGLGGRDVLAAHAVDSLLVTRS